MRFKSIKFITGTGCLKPLQLSCPPRNLLARIFVSLKLFSLRELLQLLPVRNIESRFFTWPVVTLAPVRLLKMLFGSLLIQSFPDWGIACFEMAFTTG